MSKANEVNPAVLLALVRVFSVALSSMTHAAGLASLADGETDGEALVEAARQQIMRTIANIDLDEIPIELETPAMEHAMRIVNETINVGLKGYRASIAAGPDRTGP